MARGTRAKRIEIASEAERRFRRKVSWGAECGETRGLFTTFGAPVMTRLRQPERRVLDTLVEAGVARSRSHALAWCVHLVGKHEADWIADLNEALTEVEKVRTRRAQVRTNVAAMPDPNQGGLLDRLGNLVELITTLDVRVTNALEGLEEMRSSVTGLDPVRDDVEVLVADLKTRLDTWDRRLARDLDELKTLAIEKLNGVDELKAALLAKIEEVDVSDITTRFDRMETALMNVERATVNLNNIVQGGMEALPNFVTKRVQADARKQAAAAPAEPLTHDDLGH